MRILIKPDVVSRFFLAVYKNPIEDLSDRNYLFDFGAGPLTVEVKERTLDNYSYYQNDLLLEYIQAKDSMNSEDPYNIFKAIGWLFKTDCDRLAYFKYPENNREYTIYNIKWREFRAWFFTDENLLKYRNRVITSYKTTGSFNISIPVVDIPENLIEVFRWIKKGA